MEELIVKLLINGVGIANDVHPVFGDDIKINLDREENQIFRREKIEGTFQFFGADFELIYGCSIYTTFTLQIYRGNALVGSADFIRTDCEFNLDDGICQVKLTTKDIYEKFLNSYENKYNLVKLAPERDVVTLTKRTILQFYVRGENVVTNVIGGVHYEQSCQEVYEDSDLRDKYHFGGVLPLSYIEIAEDNTELIAREFHGTYYIDNTYAGAQEIRYINASNPERLLFLKHLSDGRWLILAKYLNDDVLKADGYINSIQSGSQKFTLAQSGVGESTAEGTFHSDGDLYCRLLLPKQTSGSFQRSVNADITEYDSNYPYVGGVSADAFASKIKVEVGKSTTPTEWGIDSSGAYFLYPTLNESQKTEGVSPIPIGQSHWERMSSWLLFDDALSDLVDDYDLEYTLKDAYPLWSAIKVLLNQIDPTLSFENNYNYSEFLFGAREYSQHLLSYNFPAYRSNIYITPITNVKKTFYEQAAQKGDISLKQILDMLRTFYQCYWWIDADNRLRIEHIIYFKNGMTYESETPIATIDVTTKENLPTRESWGFGQNTLGFETGKCPARYEFAWGDECTYPFVGEPIDLIDKYLDSSKKESVSVTNFISDVDYIVTNGVDISNDIFAIFEADKNTGKVRIFDVRLNDVSPKYRLQNAFLSFLFAEQYFYPYDLSGWRAAAGNSSLKVFRTKEIVKQSLSCPLTLEEIRSIGVIRTEVGNGIIDKMSAEICTLYAKNTILYEQGENFSDRLYFRDYSAHGGYVQYFNPSYRNIRAKIGIKQGDVITSIRYVDIPLRGIIRDQTEAGQHPVILDSEDVTAFTINRMFRKADGQMTLDESSSSQGVYVLNIKGNGFAGSDFAGIHISTRRQIKVKIETSTEENYDKAYISGVSPCCNSTANALNIVSGLNSIEVVIPAGLSRYIGYVKDGTNVANEDIVKITIEEV